MNRTQFNDEALDQIKDLTALMTSEFKRFFPNGWIKAQEDHHFCTSGSVIFGLISDKKDLSGGYINNDPMLHNFYISKPTKKGLCVEMRNARISANPPAGSYLAIYNVAPKFRKYTHNDNKKIMVRFTNYLESLKKTLLENKDNMYGRIPVHYFPE